MSPENIETYLKKLTAIPRYNSAFRKLFGILIKQGVEPTQATVTQVAQGIWELHQTSPAEARNAYSSMLLFPGFQALRFQTVIQTMKKDWKGDRPKYAAFWSPEPILRRLLAAKVEPKSLTL